MDDCSVDSLGYRLCFRGMGARQDDGNNHGGTGETTSVRASSQAIAEASGRVGGIIGIAGYSFLAAVRGPGAGLLFFWGYDASRNDYQPGHLAGNQERCTSVL